jgi:CHAT domain-containing protein
MESFYANLLSGQEPGPALRRAQLEMIAKARKENTPDHPFLWAAFQYVK